MANNSLSVSDKTKDTTSSMMSTSKLGEDAAQENLSSPKEILGAMYNLMMVIEDERKREYKFKEISEKQKRKTEDTYHKQLIKALTPRRTPKKLSKAPEVKPVTPETKGSPAPAATKPTTTPPTTPPKAPPATPPKTTPPAATTPPKAPPTATKPAAPPKAPAEPIKQAENLGTRTPKNPRTATKIGVGAAMTTTSVLFGREALASNISKYESKGSSGKSFGGDEYNAYNKGTLDNKIIPADKPIDFSQMSVSEFLRRGSLSPGDPDRLFAVGRYQIIPKTMEGLIKSLKLDPKTTYLDSATQDLLFAKGLTTSVQGRGAVDDYIKGKPGVTRDDAILALAKEFASIGVPYDTERVSKNKKGEVTSTVPIKKGQSYYSGVGGNQAHNSPEEVGAALDADRAKVLGLAPKANELPVSNSGQQVNTQSTQNGDLRKSLQRDAYNQSQTANINVSAPGSTQAPPNTKVDDRSPYNKAKGQ